MIQRTKHIMSSMIKNRFIEGATSNCIGCFEVAINILFRL